MKKIILAVALSFSFYALSSETFVKGAGSEFKMNSNGVSSKLNIYITESSFTRLGIEYHFATSGLIQKQMWQQFILGLNSDGPLSMEAGYVKTPELSKPEKLTSEYLNVNKGVKLDQFFFSKKKELQKYFIGNENIEVPAGNLQAAHYRKKNNGQVVDFWISEKVKPIGMVKLVSKNPKEMAQNYEIELVSLLRNVKATINPKEARPLTEKGKSALAIPIKK
ncbi:MAG: hypothetical protein CME70_10060 [Halobacteriovorax sp.]|nr:hypothetical protein [Halobacteriovorax sp.]